MDFPQPDPALISNIRKHLAALGVGSNHQVSIVGPFNEREKGPLRVVIQGPQTPISQHLGSIRLSTRIPLSFEFGNVENHPYGFNLNTNTWNGLPGLRISQSVRDTNQTAGSKTKSIRVPLPLKHNTPVAELERTIKEWFPYWYKIATQPDSLVLTTYETTYEALLHLLTHYWEYHGKQKPRPTQTQQSVDMTFQVALSAGSPDLLQDYLKTHSAPPHVLDKLEKMKVQIHCYRKDFDVLKKLIGQWKKDLQPPAQPQTPAPSFKWPPASQWDREGNLVVTLSPSDQIQLKKFIEDRFGYKLETSQTGSTISFQSPDQHGPQMLQFLLNTWIWAMDKKRRKAAYRLWKELALLPNLTWVDCSDLPLTHFSAMEDFLGESHPLVVEYRKAEKDFEADGSGERFSEAMDALEKEAYAKGFVRVVQTDGKLYYEGNPSQKQLAELKDTAIERGLLLERDNPNRTGSRRYASAYIQDLSIADLPKDVLKDLAPFLPPGLSKKTRIVQYGMVVPELIQKADPHNLETAQEHLKGESKKKLEKEFYEKEPSKYLFLLNDRLVDGHHFLAKAEAIGVSKSLKVLDLTPIRFQEGKRSGQKDGLYYSSKIDPAPQREQIAEELEEIQDEGLGYEDPDHPKSKKLERQYQALTAIDYVLANQQKSSGKEADNLFRYLVGKNGFVEAAIHLRKKGSGVEVLWIGSTIPGAGARLLEEATAEAKSIWNSEEVTLTSKYGSDPFYQKQGFEKGETKANLVGEQMSSFSRRLSQKVNWSTTDPAIGVVPNQASIDYFGFVKPMTPREFLDLVPPGTSAPNQEKFSKMMQEGEAFGPPFLLTDWDDQNKVWRVWDHEGRSRSHAAHSLDPDIQIPVHIFPGNGMRARDITDDMKAAPFVGQKGSPSAKRTASITFQPDGAWKIAQPKMLGDITYDFAEVLNTISHIPYHYVEVPYEDANAYFEPLGKIEVDIIPDSDTTTTPEDVERAVSLFNTKYEGVFKMDWIGSSEVPRNEDGSQTFTRCLVQIVENETIHYGKVPELNVSNSNAAQILHFLKDQGLQVDPYSSGGEIGVDELKFALSDKSPELDHLEGIEHPSTQQVMDALAGETPPDDPDAWKYTDLEDDFPNTPKGPTIIDARSPLKDRFPRYTEDLKKIIEYIEANDLPRRIVYGQNSFNPPHEINPDLEADGTQVLPGPLDPNSPDKRRQYEHREMTRKDEEPVSRGVSWRIGQLSNRRFGAELPEWQSVFVGGTPDGGIGVLFVSKSPSTQKPRINYLTYPMALVAEFKTSGQTGAEWLAQRPLNLSFEYHIDSAHGHTSPTRKEVLPDSGDFQRRFDSMVQDLDHPIETIHSGISKAIADYLDHLRLPSSKLLSNR